MGQRQLWLAITAVASAQAAVYIARPLTSYRLLGLGGDARQVGLVAAAYALLPLFLAIPLGRFADRRNPAPLVLGGCATQAVACFILSVAQSIWSITAANAILGLGHLGLAVQHLIARESSGAEHDRRFAALTGGVSTSSQHRVSATSRKISFRVAFEDVIRFANGRCQNVIDASALSVGERTS
jgi:MFS family permease